MVAQVFAQHYTRTDLTADANATSPGVPNLDPNLVNAWGISRSGGSPFWVSDNGTGVSTVYRVTAANGVSKAIIGSPPNASGGVVIPPPGSGPLRRAF